MTYWIHWLATVVSNPEDVNEVSRFQGAWAIPIIMVVIGWMVVTLVMVWRGKGSDHIDLGFTDTMKMMAGTA